MTNKEEKLPATITDKIPTLTIKEKKLVALRRRINNTDVMKKVFSMRLTR